MRFQECTRCLVGLYYNVMQCHDIRFQYASYLCVYDPLVVLLVASFPDGFPMKDLEDLASSFGLFGGLADEPY